MKTSIAALAVTAASFLGTARAPAQILAEPDPPIPATGVEWGSDADPGSAVVVDPTFFPTPYSYWVSYPFSARGYVGFGANDFPFYGTAYGSPSDLWTWSAMGRLPGR